VKDAQRIVLDFAGGKLGSIPPTAVLRGVVSIAGGEEAGEIVDQYVTPNPFISGWRLSFQVRPKKREPLELRAFLDQNGQALTETWSYAILP
jgi:glucans biosynthesis protein